jgi:CHAT domain-containing protein/tetratricopeptide (TPR) repeat protein
MYRKDIMLPGAITPRNLLVIPLLCSALYCAPSAIAQQGNCSLDARNRSNTTLPIIDAEAMPPALADAIRHGFDLIAVRYAEAQGEQVLRHALTTAESEKNTCGQALALFGLAQAARNESLDQALVLLRRATPLFDTLGDRMALAHLHERVATTQHLLGDNAAFLRAAPGIAQEFQAAGDEARAIMQKSLALQYEGASPKPQEQLALLEQLKSLDAPNVVAARGFVEWETGSSMRRTGRYAEIADHMRASLADLTTCDCEPTTRAAVLLTFAVAADSSGDAATVLDYARRADAVYRKYHLDSLRPQSLRLIAAGYAHEEDWRSAIATYEIALRMAREHGAAAIAATTGLELADTYGKSGQPMKGLATLRETSSTNPTPSGQCDLHAQRMSLEIRAHLYADADTDGQVAFTQCPDIIQPATLALLHTQFAGMQMQQGHWDAALVHAREGVAIVDTQRVRVQMTDRALRTFNEQKATAYDALVSSLVHLDRPEDALLASEQFRTRAFVDLAASHPADTPTHGPPARGSGQLKSESHPFALTVAAIEDTLRQQHSTLVSYWLGADGQLTTWVLSPGKPVVQNSHAVNPVQLAALIQATEPGDIAGTRGARVERVVTRGGGQQTLAIVSRKPWRDLYGMLIAPIAANLPQEPGSVLTIVPQGALFQLSFPALLDPQGHYLIERYALHTVPSAGVLEVTAKNDHAASGLPASYLLVANPSSYPDVDGRPLPELPGTDLEVRGISHQLEGKSVMLLEGRQAGIDTLVGALPHATVLHFATHAVVSDRAPSKSFLALDKSQRGGLLTVSSVYGLHMNASLVVLSACSTGRGQISGDGVAGLSRAFFYAGAASLVTTLWDVVDEPTAELMPRFYASLAKGETRSAALRTAQLGLIDDLRHHRVRVKTLAGTSVSLPEQPSYWAAFSLSGQP